MKLLHYQFAPGVIVHIAVAPSIAEMPVPEAAARIIKEKGVAIIEDTDRPKLVLCMITCVSEFSDKAQAMALMGKFVELDPENALDYLLIVLPDEVYNQL